MVAITGIPGVGKTELAIQYGRSRRDDYLGGVVWFPAAEFGEAIRDWMQGAFFADRDLRHLSALEQQVALGWKEWEKFCGTERLALVIVDDVTDYRQQVAPYLPKVESDRSSFRFLLTGRLDLGKQIPKLELKELNSNAAVSMLARFAGVERITADRTTAETLCNRLGYLPLAIALVGCWLSIDADRTLTLLIESLERYGLAAPALERDPITAKLMAERGLNAAFAVSWAQLAEINPSAQQLARVLSLFTTTDLPWELVAAVVQEYNQSHVQPQPEPQRRSRSRRQNWFQRRLRRFWQWLCRLFGQRPRPLPPPPTSTPIADLVEAKGALLQLSLMQRVDENGQLFRLHPLLREFYADQWQGADPEGWTIALINVVSDRARSVPANISWEQAKTFDELRPHLEPVRQLLQDRVATATDPQTVKHYKQLLSNINVAAFRLSRPPLFETTFAQARKLHDEAKAAAAQGRTQEASQKFVNALEDYRKAITQAREALPADSMQLAGYLNRLANLLRDLGSYQDGIPHAEEAVRIASHKASLLKLAVYLNDLALLYHYQGRYAEAEPLYVRSLQIREQQLGADHPDTANSLHNLAGLYESQGRYTEAEPLYVRSLQIHEQQLGADHPHTATSLNNLAGLYYSQGRYAEAEPLYMRSLQIREQQLGAAHPDTASGLNNLAWLYYSQGRYGEAEPLYVRSLQIAEQQLGADHPHTATSLNNLALLYRSQGRYGEAEPLYVRSLQIREQQLGADHPDTATSLNNLALLYRSQGRYTEAEPLLVRSLQITEQQLGADHPDTASSLNNLAGLYESQGRYGEAEPLYVRSLQIREQQLGAAHPDTASGLNNLAWLYYSQGRYGEAEPLYVRSLQIYEQQLGLDHPDTQTVRNNFRYFVQQAVEAGRAEELSDHPITQAILQQIRES